MNLQTFATKERPLRASALPLLVACPLRAAMLHLDIVTDNAGKAADTGSAAHKAVAVWHESKGDSAKALKAMKAGMSAYPLADLHDAELHFRAYTADPRNQAHGDIVLLEREVTFTLPPAEDDPTQEEIVIVGHLDQVRMTGGLYRLWDLKTGKSKDGFGMIAHYTMQAAAYCIGATALLKKPVHPGGLIRSWDYRERKKDGTPRPVFWEFPWTLEDANTLMRSVRAAVATVRAARMGPQPGDHCLWCSLGSPAVCAPRLRSLPVVPAAAGRRPARKKK